jgi:hypothetical protein
VFPLFRSRPKKPYQNGNVSSKSCQLSGPVEQFSINAVTKVHGLDMIRCKSQFIFYKKDNDTTKAGLHRSGQGCLPEWLRKELAAL